MAAPVTPPRRPRPSSSLRHAVFLKFPSPGTNVTRRYPQPGSPTPSQLSLATTMAGSVAPSQAPSRAPSQAPSKAPRTPAPVEERAKIPRPSPCPSSSHRRPVARPLLARDPESEASESDNDGHDETLPVKDSGKYGMVLDPKTGLAARLF